MRFYSSFLIGIQSADVFLTRIGLNTGYLREGNALGAWILQYGFISLILAKLIATGLIFCLVWALWNYRPKWAENFLAYSCFLMSAVVMFNCIQLLKVIN